MVHISAQVLQDHVQSVFIATGVSEDRALIVASSLVESDLVGHDSHGVLRVGSYIEAIERGSVDPCADMEVVRSSATTAVIDGHRGLGVVVGRQAMSLAMAKADAHDIGMVAVRNTGHTGRMGEYAVQAASQGYVSSVMAAGPRRGGMVAPYGATSPVFNTNPMSWGLPANCYHRFPGLCHLCGRLGENPVGDRPWPIDPEKAGCWTPTGNPPPIHSGARRYAADVWRAQGIRSAFLTEAGRRVVRCQLCSARGLCRQFVLLTAVRVSSSSHSTRFDPHRWPRRRRQGRAPRRRCPRGAGSRREGVAHARAVCATARDSRVSMGEDVSAGARHGLTIAL